LVLPFWYRLTRAVPEKGPLNVCVTCRLTAKNWHQLWNPTLGNRVSGRKGIHRVKIAIWQSLNVFFVMELGIGHSTGLQLTLLLGHQKEHVVCKKFNDEVLVWLSVGSEVQIVCIWSS